MAAYTDAFGEEQTHMSKRDSDPAARWDTDDIDVEDAPAESPGLAPGAGLRPGFHLQAARRIEEARERRQLRKALEDFDDYDV